MYGKYYPRTTLLKLHPDRFSVVSKNDPNLRDRFPKRGKTILDPSMRTVQQSPELNQWSLNSGIRGASALLDRRTCKNTRKKVRL